MSTTLTPPRPPILSGPASVPTDRGGSVTGGGPGDGRGPRAERAAVPVELARAISVAFLGLVGSVGWMGMLSPAPTSRGPIALAVGLGLAGLARLFARVDRAWVRRSMLSLLAAAVLAAGMLVGGVRPAELLPWHVPDLLTGVGLGLDAVPSSRIPYSGTDPWILLVLPLGGTVLTVLSCALALWPRRRGRVGFGVLSLIGLLTLIVVPSVSRAQPLGLPLTVLVVVLAIVHLRLGRLPRRALRGAGVLAVCAVLVGAVLGTVLDRDTPWWDYEGWAQENTLSQAETFEWNHRYGVLDWPRDGRELLRVASPSQMYWKAENLDLFNGRTWQRTVQFGGVPMRQWPASPAEPESLRRDWVHQIHVRVGNLTTRQVLTAGAPISVADSGGGADDDNGSPGIVDAPARPLRRGDEYEATVYYPKPSGAEMQAAGTDLGEDAGWLDRYRQVVFGSTDRRADRQPLNAETEVTFPAFDDGSAPTGRQAAGALDAPDTEAVLEAGDMADVLALARRLKAGTSTPYGYMRAVEAYLAGSDFRYDEQPPVESGTLPGFLLRSKVGFCQQYAGAMALLMRMGGVPARVSSGFTNGAQDDGDEDVWVVRDFDAHSWVEVWYPHIGWVTRDPTPAVAPPRRTVSASTGTVHSDSADAEPSQGDVEKTADVPDGPASAAVADADSGAPVLPIVGGLAVLASVAGAAAVVARHRRGSRTAMSAEQAGEGLLRELTRAFARAGRPLPPATTLHGLQAELAATPGADGYVRVLQELRYAGRAVVPSGADRRRLRAALRRGRGPFARVRALWALPPGAGRSGRPAGVG